jgi:O-antigen/teichoic acid export membrane protein
VILYTTAICLPALLITWSLWRQDELKLKGEKNFIDKQMSREMINVSLFGIVTSFSGVIILNVDVILINHYLGLSAAGIYSIAFYFGTLVLIPSRPVVKIASVLISDGWKENNLKKINEIYQKSNIVLTVLSLLIFIGLAVNIDNIFEIIPDKYVSGKYVILLIGLANVFEMSTSLAQSIIHFSKYYRVITWYLLLFVLILLISNAILIPMYGIVGCALAALISRFIYNFLSWLFLYRKFNLQPFNFRYFYLIGITAFSFTVAYLIPEMPHFLIDMVVRSSVLVIIFGVGIYFSRISPDLNETFQNILKQLKLIK